MIRHSVSKLPSFSTINPLKDWLAGRSLDPLFLNPKSIPMKSNRFNVVMLIAALMAFIPAASWTIAQTRPDQSAEPSRLGARTADPQLFNRISKHKEQWNERLERLREIKSTLGENHPSLEKLNDQIDQAEQAALVWETSLEDLLSMSDEDLRVLVLKLAIRVGQLEQQASLLKTNQPSRPAAIGLGPRP